MDYQTPGMFEIGLEEKPARLSRSVRQGCYRPKKIRRVWLPKPGSREKRPLGIPTVEDRVMQGALRLVLEPIFERDFSDHSYGFRPRRGCKDALREVDSLLKQGCRVAVDAGIKSFFGSIPHRGLLDRVASKVSDGRVLDLIESYLVQGIMDGMSEWTPEEGTPQGAVLHGHSPQGSLSIHKAVNHQLESRVREIRKHGSEGEGIKVNTGSSYPYRVKKHEPPQTKAPNANCLQGDTHLLQETKFRPFRP